MGRGGREKEEEKAGGRRGVKGGGRKGNEGGDGENKVRATTYIHTHTHTRTHTHIHTYTRTHVSVSNCYTNTHKHTRTHTHAHTHTTLMLLHAPYAPLTRTLQYTGLLQVPFTHLFSRDLFCGESGEVHGK
jgi:hypothetical protein